MEQQNEREREREMERLAPPRHICGPQAQKNPSHFCSGAQTNQTWSGWRSQLNLVRLSSTESRAKLPRLAATNAQLPGIQFTALSQL